MGKPIILTGLRANSDLQLGNYLGALRPIIDLQKNKADDYQINLFVPDLHSFTTPIEHGKLYQQTIDNLKYFVAAGLDFNDSNTKIYRQSYVPAHSELAWILSCFTYYGELSRMTQFKDKAAQLSNSSKGDHISAGLFNYPVLMAADILLYDAQYVPVGEDQRQHLELARDIAIRMNNKFGNLFTVPYEWKRQLEFNHIDRGIRIRSLRNPERKMSKSDGDPTGTIRLTDSPNDAVNKIKSATTDNLGAINFDWDKQPGITNLLQILSLLSNRPQQEVNESWIGSNSYGDLKKTVGEAVGSFLAEFQKKLSNINESEITTKLNKDETEINKIAGETLLKVQKAVGLRP